MKKIIRLAFVGIMLAGSIALASSQTVEGAKQDLAVFKNEMSLKLNSLEHEIAKLKIQAREQGREARQRAVIELEEARDQIRKDLAELENKSESQWSKVKNRLALALDRLNTKAQRALAEN